VQADVLPRSVLGLFPLEKHYPFRESALVATRSLRKPLKLSKKSFFKTEHLKVGQNHQKAPSFCAQSIAFVTFSLVFECPVGNFYEDFSPKGFFDSLVGPFLANQK
jgi:hypothetical protein